jgi:hypothetical protein
MFTKGLKEFTTENRLRKIILQLSLPEATGPAQPSEFRNEQARCFPKTLWF